MEKTQFNLVELLDDEEQEFDQPCKFGNRVGGHAVYCHSKNPKAPRKCRNSWYYGKEHLDSECPFYQPNPNFRKAHNSKC